MPENITVLCQEYFNAFSSKDLGALEKIYDEDVALLDWEQSVVGKSAVLDANRGLFEQVDTLEIVVVKIHVADRVAACEISIVINGELTLKVLDLITWTPQGQILKVDAYRQ